MRIHEKTTNCLTKGVTLTRKHFRLAAKMLRETKVKRDSAIYKEIVDCLRESNPRFNESIFESAVFGG